MDRVDAVVIGGGPAGMMAALKIAEAGHSVTLLEKKLECGKKLLITGKGRCNLTNSKPWKEFSDHVYPDSSFFKTSFYTFSNEDLVNFFQNQGLALVCERGDRVYPESNLSRSVRDTLEKSCKKAGVNIVNSATVISSTKSNEDFYITYICDYLLDPNFNKKISLERISIIAKTIVVATGGLSYPSTGSTGDGYEFAKSFGHSIVDTMPCLTALRPRLYNNSFQLMTLKNVKLSLLINGNEVQSEFGELQFTNGGIEGAIGFKLSKKAVKALRNGEKVVLVMDLKPAVSTEQLVSRINREYADLKMKNKKGKVIGVEDLLRRLMPLTCIPPFVLTNPNATIEKLPNLLKNWKFEIADYVGYERCVITAGGVSLKEVSRKTMESKLVPGLYFAGEVLDLDAATGGYNLQIAFSTGYVAGVSAASRIESSKEL